MCDGNVLACESNLGYKAGGGTDSCPSDSGDTVGRLVGYLLLYKKWDAKRTMHQLFCGCGSACFLHGREMEIVADGSGGDGVCESCMGICTTLSSRQTI